MKLKRLHPNPSLLWVAFFGVWLVLLTGVLHPWISPPGVLQQARLSSLLRSQEDQIQQLEAQISTLEADQLQMSQSSVVQEREVRRVLGFLKDDEIVFDFSLEDSTQ
jgi:cell division protein FtsB